MDAAEVSKHRTRDSCWIVIDKQIYDTTNFLYDHPGGPAIILKYGGANATQAFREIHADSILQEHRSMVHHLGAIKDPEALPQSNQASSAREKQSPSQLRPLVSNVILDDFEEVAKKVMPDRTWTYVSSSAQNHGNLQRYRKQWQRVHFRPRVMRDVTTVDTTASMLGYKSRIPVFICPTGLVGSVHKDAELVLARAAARTGIHYCVSTASTRPLEEIAAAFNAERAKTKQSHEQCGQLFFQLYVHTDQNVTRNLIERAKRSGFKGLAITVDTPIIGKRIEDRRMQALELIEAGLMDESGDGQGVGQSQTRTSASSGWGDAEEDKPKIGGRVAPGVLSSSLKWDDLKWIRELWGGPIVLKGIQTADDAQLALDLGCQGIWLSNHGGRQLQYAPNSLETLIEIRQRCPQILDKLECFLDGGFHTGPDVVKGMCLGATAVGIGRPFLYAAAAYGTAGIERVTDSTSSNFLDTMAWLLTSTQS